MFVPFILGSKVDNDHAMKIAKTLEEFGVSYKIHVSSAHKVPEKTLAIIDSYNKSGDKIVFITIAGRSNALSGVVSGNTNYPVIACPPFSDKADYLINIHSSIQMPSETPAMTVVDTQNAAMAALKILALTDEGLTAKINAHIKSVKDSFDA